MSDVKILDAGDKLLFSGAEAVDVEAKLNYYIGLGSRIISPVSRVGSAWVAACSPPPAAKEADKTSTLLLSGIAAATRPTQPQGTGPCKVESLGFKHIIIGPTRSDVAAKLAEMIEMGATVVSEPEQEGGEWVAVCDSGGALNTGFRWGPDAKT